MSVKVAMMQPSFLPWIGLFELIACSDKFIFLDDFQYVPRSHHTRNKLFRNKGVVDYYTVPVKKSESFGLPINQTKLQSDDRWKKKILRGLEVNYAKSAYFPTIYPKVENWLNQNYDSLAPLNITFILEMCRLLEIKTTFLYSSDFTKESNSRSQRSQRISELLNWVHADIYLSAFGSFDYMEEDVFLQICDIPVLFQNHIPAVYPQTGSEVFVPYLSALDTLFNIGPQQTLKKALAGTAHWLTWEERKVLS